MSAFDVLPRLDIIWPENANSEEERASFGATAILEFAANLGAESAFQVWYPETTAENYDVLVVIGGQIGTVPGELPAGVMDQLSKEGS